MGTNVWRNVLPLSSIMKIKARGLSETLVPIYQTTRLHITPYCILHVALRVSNSARFGCMAAETYRIKFTSVQCWNICRRFVWEKGTEFHAQTYSWAPALSCLMGYWGKSAYTGSWWTTSLKCKDQILPPKFLSGPPSCCEYWPIIIFSLYCHFYKWLQNLSTPGLMLKLRMRRAVPPFSHMISWA
jgi:hypothetical protein